MILDLEKLNDCGFEWDLKAKKLIINPSHDLIPNKELQNAIREVGAIMGFDERETDDLFGAAHKIQVMSVIRRCSNW